MPLINFQEIPSSKGGTRGQDSFELFCRAALELMGFEIQAEPARGTDGGCDLIVTEDRSGPGGTTKIKWMVSCKHFAHSGDAVGTSAKRGETDILDRVKQASCSGFMGFYSTIPSAGLRGRVTALSQDMDVLIMDHESIEERILSIPGWEVIVARFFPKSYERARISARRPRARLAGGIEVRFDKILRDPSIENDRLFHQSIEDPLLAAVLADEIHSGSFEIFRQFTSIRKSLLERLVTEVSQRELDEGPLSKAILVEENTLTLRTMISLAGHLRATSCAEPICRVLVNRGGRHHTIVAHSGMQVTPFRSVVQGALRALLPEAKQAILKFREIATERQSWQAKRLLESVLSVSD